MNSKAANNLSKVRISYFVLPIMLLTSVFCFLFYYKALSNDSYIQVQKDFFLFGNAKLSQFPSLIHNLTQLGDGLIILSFLTILFVFAPKCWECFFNAFIISGIFTAILKPLFKIQRPAAALLHDNFTIIGPKLTGNNSFPSGHSITTFTILSVILFAFMPRDFKQRILWCFCICTIGAILISTRVGVGAHYPIDVFVGAVVGYLSAIIGVMITQKVKLWCWIANPKFYPFFIVLFASCIVAIIVKILDSNLFIFYLALISLLISIFVITKIYVQKKF